MARALLDGRSAEEIAVAMVRFYRARLPAPEEIFDAGPERGERRREKRDHRDDRTDRRERREKGVEEVRQSDNMVWFRMNVGRRNNADPRWLIPIICRIGHVTKKEIGAIRIFDQETKFEIATSVAPRFAAASRKASDEDMRIEPAAFDRPDRRDEARKPATKGGKKVGQPPPRKKPRPSEKRKRS